MTSTPDHRWLMQYHIVNLVNQCRRLIKAEFDQALSLSDPQLREKLAHYAGHSRSQGLQRLYGEVRLALIKLEGQDPMPKPEKTRSANGTRIYRGQPVSAHAATTPHERTSKIMYRGRTLA